MYVICFYWQGDRWQEDNFRDERGYHNTFEKHLSRAGRINQPLAVKYINNLYRGVRRFATQDFQFICFTNEPLKEGLEEGVEIRPFQQVTRKGVLPRVFMFSRHAGLFGHQVFCLDLDVVITGTLKDFMNYEGLFCTRSNFHPANEKRMDGDIMSFRAGPETEDIFWTPLVNDVERAERITMGRERFWLRHCGEHLAELWDKYAPGQVVSYKRHIKKRHKEIPPGISIVSCHGAPRPHQIKDKWIKQYWQ